MGSKMIIASTGCALAAFLLSSGRPGADVVDGLKLKLVSPMQLSSMKSQPEPMSQMGLMQGRHGYETGSNYSSTSSEAGEDFYEEKYYELLEEHDFLLRSLHWHLLNAKASLHEMESIIYRNSANKYANYDEKFVGMMHAAQTGVESSRKEILQALEAIQPVPALEEVAYEKVDASEAAPRGHSVDAPTDVVGQLHVGDSTEMLVSGASLALTDEDLALLDEGGDAEAFEDIMSALAHDHAPTRPEVYLYLPGERVQVRKQTTGNPAILEISGSSGRICNAEEVAPNSSFSKRYDGRHFFLRPAEGEREQDDYIFCVKIDGKDEPYHVPHTKLESLVNMPDDEVSVTELHELMPHATAQGVADELVDKYGRNDEKIVYRKFIRIEKLFVGDEDGALSLSSQFPTVAGNNGPIEVVVRNMSDTKLAEGSDHTLEELNGRTGKIVRCKRGGESVSEYTSSDGVRGVCVGFADLNMRGWPGSVQA